MQADASAAGLGQSTLPTTALTLKGHMSSSPQAYLPLLWVQLVQEKPSPTWCHALRED
jgi:hypothetical protein